MGRRASDWERHRAKEIAEAVLDGRTMILEGARELSPLAHTDAIANEDDRRLIIGIDSETDHLPVGKVREHWAADALEAKDAEITIAEERWKARFRDVCKRIAEPSSVDRVNEFYKKGCQEKSSASTGVEICFSRSSPLSIGCAAMSFG